MQQSFVDIATKRQSILVEEAEKDREERRRLRDEARCHDNTSFLLPEDSMTMMSNTKTKTSKLRKMLDREREESNRYLKHLIYDVLICVITSFSQ